MAAAHPNFCHFPLDIYNPSPYDVFMASISIDDIRDGLIAQGNDFRHAMGKSFPIWKDRIDKWLADGGNLVVVFGAPGAGKSYLLKRLKIADDFGIFVDITGLNISQNKFILSLPQDKVNYVSVRVPLNICISRIEARPPRALDAACGAIHVDSHAYLIELAKRWFDCYNEGAVWEWKLPEERCITFTPNNPHKD